MTIDSRVSRRKFLQSAAVAGAGAALPASGLLAQAPANSRTALRRVDVHHHMYPPFYVKAMQQPGGNPINTRNWTPKTSLDMMDKAGIETSLVSPVQGLVRDSLNDKSERARGLAKQSNEYCAQMVRDNPKRFGFFAALPLPDPDGSLKEVAYAYDTLKADGIGLWTSYQDKWVGDPAFWPVYEELNRRNAVVFYHPARPSCCRELPGQSGIIEFDVDTARAIDSLLWQGTLAKFPNVRHIFVHSGGEFPTLAARIIDDFPKNRADKVPNGTEHEIKKLYFDVAHASKASALDALKAVVPISQMLYGSDAPLREYDLTDGGLDVYAGFSKTIEADQPRQRERLFRV